MKILVVGSGGREHALVKSFFEGASVKKVYACPGNVGMRQQAELISLNLKIHSEVVHFCIKEKIDFVFIGPEEFLVDGLADSLRAENILVVGPSGKAAQLEGSKIFAKQFMQQAGVATADANVVTTVTETLMAAETHKPPYILKADGLAAGKGVYICKNLAELKTAAENIFEKKILGSAGEKALLEKNLPGDELSVLILTNGESYQILPLAQDHKRLKDNNEGPNTGGMGTVAPLQIDSDLMNKIEERILKPSVIELKKQNLLFRGILFIGIMVVDNQPYALEYNVRFGDPETQVILPLIKNDIAQLFLHLAKGEVDKLEVNGKTSFCIINAAPGYPDQVKKNISIELPANETSAYILHAGTSLNENSQLVSNGGRVLNVVSISDNYSESRKNAYELNEKIKFEGRQFRTDLGNYQFQRKDN